MTDEEIPQRPRKLKAQGARTDFDDAPTPTQDAIAGSRRTPAYVTDDLGRLLKVKPLSLLDHMRVSRVLGSELAKNDSYRAFASLAFMVIELNGEPVIPPTTVREVEFFVDRLGDEGAQAIGKAHTENGWSRVVSEDDVVDAAKNS